MRAVAVVAVVIFHLQSFLPSALEPIERVGWAGVDLFFVLSGFLIGSQLFAPLRFGRRPDLKAFYARRAFRILPAYLAVLALYFALPVWREQPKLPSAWKFLTFTSNLAMHYPAELAFSHAWSLCVEEHFYFVFPCLVLWQMRRPAAWKTVTFLTSVVLGGVLIRGWMLVHIVRAPGLADEQTWPLFMKYVYYPTYCRLDGLVSGVALASIRTFRPAWWAKLSRCGNALLIAGLLVTAAALWTFGGEYPSPDRTAGVLYGFPMLALGFGLLVASAASSKGGLRMRIPGAKMLATLAYSLYLTHKEVAHIDRAVLPWLEQEAGWRAAAVYAGTCLAVAGLLYLLVERPFLLVRDRVGIGAASGQEKEEVTVDVVSS